MEEAVQIISQAKTGNKCERDREKERERETVFGCVSVYVLHTVYLHHGSIPSLQCSPPLLNWLG